MGFGGARWSVGGRRAAACYLGGDHDACKLRGAVGAECQPQHAVPRVLACDGEPVDGSGARAGQGQAVGQWVGREKGGRVGARGCGFQCGSGWRSRLCSRRRTGWLGAIRRCGPMPLHVRVHCDPGAFVRARHSHGRNDKATGGAGRRARGHTAQTWPTYGVLSASPGGAAARRRWHRGLAGVDQATAAGTGAERCRRPPRLTAPLPGARVPASGELIGEVPGP